MKLIKLTRGQWALVDDKDYEWLNQWKWHANFNKTTKSYYACRALRESERAINNKAAKVGNITMSRVILNAPQEMQVDHIDRNSLNNQRHNLRLCTREQNLQNKSLSTINTSGAKGVYKYERKGKVYWQAGIKGGPRKIIIGSYRNKTKAILAYNLTAKILFGEFAWLNPVADKDVVLNVRDLSQISERLLKATAVMPLLNKKKSKPVVIDVEYKTA